jgi:hypothetical protein
MEGSHVKSKSDTLVPILNEDAQWKKERIIPSDLKLFFNLEINEHWGIFFQKLKDILRWYVHFKWDVRSAACEQTIELWIIRQTICCVKESGGATKSIKICSFWKGEFLCSMEKWHFTALHWCSRVVSLFSCFTDFSARSAYIMIIIIATFWDGLTRSIDRLLLVTNFNHRSALHHS